MSRVAFGIITILLSFSGYSQYWFGPKIGGHLVSHRYQLEEYATDSFNIEPDLRWQAGFVLTYTASERYSVHGEINFERIGRKLTNYENQPPIVTSKLVSSFISIPLMLRINFGRPPIHYYLNGGPKISFWLGGKGFIADLEEFNEFRANDPRLDYRLNFNADRPDQIDEDPARLLLNEPNIVQYALAVGGGGYFDLPDGSRIMLDIRYSYGHSNMGFNDNPDFTFVEYEENWKYAHDMLSISVGYMWEFNAQLPRKGRSTSKQSNKKR